MLDLTPKELEASLWCIHIVEAATPYEPSYGETLGSLKRKLFEEAHTAPRKGADIPGPVVLVEGKDWNSSDYRGGRVP